MARPRTPIGTFGEIEFTNLPNGNVRARVRFRDYDGQVRRVEASDSTRKLAEHRLKEKLAQRSGPSSGTGELTADSSFTRLVEVWLGDLDLEGKIALSTRALYERNMRQLVMPAFEHFTLREITVSRVDQFIKTLATTRSYSTAKQARTVLSLALGLAVRYEALAKNPVRDTVRLRKPPSTAMALTVEQVEAIRRAVRSWRRESGLAGYMEGPSSWPSKAAAKECIRIAQRGSTARDHLVPPDEQRVAPSLRARQHRRRRSRHAPNRPQRSSESGQRDAQAPRRQRDQRHRHRG